jgi:ABC-2 type transport system permease protein
MNLIINFIIKEFLQFKRDRKMFAVILVAPLFQLVFLGYAATLDVKKVQTAVFDQDRSYESRGFIRRLSSSGYFNPAYYVTSYKEMTQLVENGTVLMGVVIPADFEKNIYRNRTADVQTIFDGSDGNKAAIAAGYMQSITSSFGYSLINRFMDKTGLKNLPASSRTDIEPEVRIWYNPGLTTRNYMLPGIVGLLIMLVTINLTALAIVKEKELGTLEQLIVTPIKPYQMIIGKLVPFSIIGFTTVILVLTVMRFWFGIPIKGSVVLLFFSAFIFMLSTLGLGLFVSTISRTQQQATMTTMFGVMMPMMFLSGFAFPIENMPGVIRYVTYLVPLRYFLTIVRGIILKGIGFEDLWKEFAILLMFGVIILTLSSLRFRKKLE